MNNEQQRLTENGWKKWGPYVSDRQWGTVREDYSAGGDAWKYTTHDMARSKAWRWGEEGIAGICDDQQILCFAIALWNGKDPILKERLFGLSNPQGNHGEDVKEAWYYLDSAPTHSYCKGLYKYPQEEYPYRRLVEEAGRREQHGSRVTAWVPRQARWVGLVEAAVANQGKRRHAAERWAPGRRAEIVCHDLARVAAIEERRVRGSGRPRLLPARSIIGVSSRPRPPRRHR